jgi:hypothetical protein
MNNDPYQPPAAPVSVNFGNEGQISPLALQHLIRTQPWVRLASVIGFIMTLLMVASMIYLVTLAGRAVRSDTTGALLISVLVWCGVTVPPLIWLNKYATAISRLKFSQSMTDLEDALNQQRAFWKFVAIVMLISVIVMTINWIFGQTRPLAPYRS